MRFAYEPPPVLAPLNTPAVSGATGLGTGGGAAVQTPDSGGWGEIYVYAGPNATAAGSVALTFPQTPPSLFIAADDVFGQVTQATVGNVVTISWAAATWPKTQGPRKRSVIAYEWSVSQ